MNEYKNEIARMFAEIDALFDEAETVLGFKFAEKTVIDAAWEILMDSIENSIEDDWVEVLE